MRFWLLLVLNLCCYSLLADTQQQTELTTQLLKMAEQSRAIQKQLTAPQQSQSSAALLTMAQQLNALHNQTLSAIVAKHGWPNKALVGTSGVKAAFTIVRNSNDLALQQDMLPFVLQSYLDQDGLSGQEVAELTDNVYINLGKAQVFGTQANWVNGQIVFLPIKNKEVVNQLREQLGLPSLAEYKKSLKLYYQSQGLD